MQQKAIYYGQVELVPGIICDGYILEDKQTTVMSTRGTAQLLGMDHKTLQSVGGNWPPKSLKSYSEKGLSVGGNFIEVVAKNSPHKGRKIDVYTTENIETLIRTYALAFVDGGLRKNQVHIGKRAAMLSISLIRTALDTAIKEACGFTPKIQETAQKNYKSATEVIAEFGFKCSLENIATKKDIVDFLKVPQSTLNSFLYKHSSEIKPIKLSSKEIKSIGGRAKRMNGYHIGDVAKIAFGMDTARGIELKKKMFGEVGTFAKTHAKDEVQWQNILSKVFEGFEVHHNYCIGKNRYKIDFFIPELLLCLECNGYSHRYYDPQEEQEREKLITEKYALIRFDHKTSLEKLMNAILRVKPKEIVCIGKCTKNNGSLISLNCQN